ncbi:MAG: ABC-type sugar transport system substrate-binding protein [Flavobacteriales bacterium]|jgi:ABC-type sugar transport system substrate-binding protein
MSLRGGGSSHAPILNPGFSPDFKTKLKVVLMMSEDFEFWRSAQNFALEVAHDLDIELTVQPAGNRFESLRSLKALVKSGNKPDFLIFPYPLGTGNKMLDIVEAAGINTFLYNSDISLIDRAELGRPRENYRYWLGHMFPDDEQVGYILADTLIRLRREALDVDPGRRDSIIQLAGIGGASSSLPAILRNSGFKRRVSDGHGLQLRRIAHIEWTNPAPAVHVLFKSYPDLDILWTAADILAIDSIGPAESLGFISGEDFLIGGVDWSPAGVEAVADGRIAVSVGGHYQEAGWALVLLNDLYYGVDFADDPGVVIKLPMSALTQKNVDIYQSIFTNERWKQVDFKYFSKYYNPNLKSYDFSIDRFFYEFNRLP